MSELKTEAWLVDNASGFGADVKHEFSVVLSPLTDDTYLDEGDEAHALCRLEVAQGIIEGLSAALTAESKQHAAVRNQLTTATSRAVEAERDASMYRAWRDDPFAVNRFCWTDDADFEAMLSRELGLDAALSTKGA